MILKERILTKAGSLFCQYGVKSVSMNDISSSLGISKRTIYENFNDKEDIILTYLTFMRDQRNARVKEVLANSSNVIEVFLHFIEIHKNMDFPSTKYYEDIYKYYPHIYQLIQKEIENNKVHIKEFLQQGMKQGFIREELNVDVAAFLVDESTYTYIRASYLEKPPFSFQELFFTMMVNFIRGISTDRGIKIIDEYLANKK